MSGIADFFAQIIRLYHIPITFLGDGITPLTWIIGVFIVIFSVKLLATLLDYHSFDSWGFWGSTHNDKDIK